MSTLDGSIWRKRSIALTRPARTHFQGTQSKERWDQGWDEDSRTNTPRQIPTGQIPTGHIPTGQLPPLQNTPWTYTHHKMKCEEKP